MKKLRSLPLQDAWFIWFFLGIVMLNYPFLHIFNKNVQLFGIPLTVLYFFLGWPSAIVIIYLFSVYLGRDQEEPDTFDKNQQKSTGEHK